MKNIIDRLREPSSYAAVAAACALAGVLLFVPGIPGALKAILVVGLGAAGVGILLPELKKRLD